MAAAALREGRTLKVASCLKGIGKPLIKEDALDKVQGKPVYTDDLPVPGALYGELVLSEHAHGEILSIDTKAAGAVEGVAAVLTAKDIPGSNLVGAMQKRQPVLADKKVRYLGDAVALVLAEDKASAQKAAALVKVDYKPLPGIFRMEEAEFSDIKIYEDGNVLSRLSIDRGNVEEGFARADVIVETRVSVPPIEHAYMEPDAVYTYWDEEGVLVVSTQSQSSFAFQEEIAGNLNLPLEKVRVITRQTGGAFGGREEPSIQVHAALGTWITGRPVHMVMDRSDVMLRTTKRHGEILNYRIGALKNGKLTAFDANILADTGAYPSTGEAVLFRSVLFAAGPYEIENGRVRGTAVYTNTSPAGAMRGFGSNQPAVAMESLMDELARKLDMDPIELRLVNALSEGKQNLGGQVLKDSVGIEESLHVLKEKLEKEKEAWSLSDGRKLGIGIASGVKNVGLGGGIYDAAEIWAGLRAGRPVFAIASVDSGQGSDTVARQIAAESLHCPPEMVDLITNDTAHCCDSGVTTASRQTVLTGRAVKEGAARLGEKILEAAARHKGRGKEELAIRDGAVVLAESGAFFMDFKTLCELEGDLEVQVRYVSPKTVPFPSRTDNPGNADEAFRVHFAYNYGSQAAIVAVDEATGDVEVLKIIAVHDVGRSINSLGVKGQIEGGIVMGMGYALSEEYLMNERGVLTKTFRKIGVPTIEKTPEMEYHLIESPMSEGPYGAKGLGEITMVPTTPAILNAIYDAVGLRIRDLPAKASKIREGLEKHSGSGA